jgi:hypothetical protein
MKNNIALRIVAGIIAFALIGGILFVTNAFVGNPVSAKIAGNAVRKYVEDKYNFLDLEIEKPIYSFKD